jgi:hypothetical protein
MAVHAKVGPSTLTFRRTGSDVTRGSVGISTDQCKCSLLTVVPDRSLCYSMAAVIFKLVKVR